MPAGRSTRIVHSWDHRRVGSRVPRLCQPCSRFAGLPGQHDRQGRGTPVNHPVQSRPSGNPQPRNWERLWKQEAVARTFGATGPLSGGNLLEKRIAGGESTCRFGFRGRSPVSLRNRRPKRPLTAICLQPAQKQSAGACCTSIDRRKLCGFDEPVRHFGFGRQVPDRGWSERRAGPRSDDPPGQMPLRRPCRRPKVSAVRMPACSTGRNRPVGRGALTTHRKAIAGRELGKSASGPLQGGGQER